MKCRQCGIEGGSVSGIYGIPSAKILFREVYQHRRDIWKEFERKILYYCQACWLRQTLTNKPTWWSDINRVHCSWCGIYGGKERGVEFFHNNKRIGLHYHPGEYIKTDEFPLKTSGDLCHRCFEEFVTNNYIQKIQNEDDLTENDSEVRQVSCDICFEKYEDVFHNQDQGIDCAGYVSEIGIHFGYGSSHDSERFEWTCGYIPDIYRECRLICDKCAMYLVQKQILVLPEKDPLAS